ncbi:unnamed protein product [Sphenostylis stenocarpa]|uniref:FAF domain-containing protein n=1 Tax=Sphenostylis stenocarpa TaxID=92480 RepID=A0AA86SSG6_9FABA|nr:unnamed protein product [Sphenostylis stenocarpa]
MSSLIIPLKSDDYIGTESCMDLQNTNHVLDQHENYKSNKLGNDAKAINKTKKKENKVFPPPIPLLARTQNLASHMPWVLKRYYTSEGRLILKEKKVKHHEYFRAHRANGRLTLHLVNVSFDDYDEYFEETAPTSPHEEADIHNVTHDHTGAVTTSNDRVDEEEENVASNSTVADEFLVEHESDFVVANGTSRVTCSDSSSVRSGPACNIFGVPVHPIRTVHG